MENQNQKKIKFGIVLGLILGLSPLFSIQTVIMICLLLFMNFSIIIFSISFLVFKTIFVLCAPLFANLGLSVLKLSLLKYPLTLIYNTPLLPLTFFHHAQVLGAMISGLLLVGIILILNRFYKKEIHQSFYFSKWYAKVAIVIIFIGYFFINFSGHLKKSLESQISLVMEKPSSIETLSFDSFVSKISIKNTNLNFDNQSLTLGKIEIHLNPIALMWGRLNIEDVQISEIDFKENQNKIEKNGLTDFKIKIKLKEELDRVSSGLTGDQFAKLLDLGDPIEKIDSINKVLLTEKETEQLINKNQALIEKWSKEKGQLVSTKNLTSELKSEILSKVEKDIEQILLNQKMIDEKENKDLQTLKSELFIPSTKISDLSLQLFGENLVNELSLLKHYQSILRDYLLEKKFHPHVVHFEVWNSYPTFEIKKLISISPQTNLVNGSINAELNHLSTDPLISNKPILLFLSANFPKKAIRGVLATLTLDYRKKARESLSLNIKNFPVKNKFFLSNLGIEEGKGSLSYLFQFTNDKFRIEKTNEFKKFKPFVQIKNKLIEKITKKSLSEASEIRIDSRIVGTWENNNIQIKSKFGETLASELFDKNKSKLEALAPEIEKLFIQKIKHKKDEITEQVSTLTKIKEEITLL